MSSTKRYEIHQDFAKFPVINLRFNLMIIGFLNLLMRVTRLRRKRFDAVTVARHTTAGEDGCQFELKVVTPKYARELAACGNAPVLNETRGTIHGYDGAANNEIAVASMQKRIDFLRLVFA